MDAGGAGSGKNRFIILDTTLRDGEQTPGVNLNVAEKLEIARLLETMGVDWIEAGFPASSHGDFEAVRAIADSVGCGVAALCRCRHADIDRAWEALKGAKRPRIHILLATSDIHLEHKLKMTRAQALATAREFVLYSLGLCGDVQFSCEDASRSDPAFLAELLEAVIDAGAGTVNIADTVGYAVPSEFGALVRGLAARVPNIAKAAISVHCHNDLGLAAANTLAALQNGARQAETTVNGLGERAGNCSMEEIVMAADTRGDSLGLAHSIDTTRIYRVSQRVAALTGVPIPVCKAIVGANAFAHESGIHQHGVMQNPMTYEIMTPQSVGKAGRSIVLGKLSGRHAFASRLLELGHSLGEEDIDAAFSRFKELADRKKTVTDEDIEALVNQITDVPETYALDTFQIMSGNKAQAMASVKLRREGAELMEAATGDGPIDAAYNAIARIAGGGWSLASYSLQAVTGGMDALGEVTVRVRHGEAVHVGRGLSLDVIEASILAFVAAINRALAA